MSPKPRILLNLMTLECLYFTKKEHASNIDYSFKLIYGLIFIICTGASIFAPWLRPSNCAPWHKIKQHFIRWDLWSACRGLWFGQEPWQCHHVSCGRVLWVHSTRYVEIMNPIIWMNNYFCLSFSAHSLLFGGLGIKLQKPKKYWNNI